MQRLNRLWGRALSVFVLLWAAIAGADLPAADRREGDEAFRHELAALADKCDELNLPEQGSLCRAWLIERDPRRHYLFLPATIDATRPKPDDPQLIRFWHARFTQLRTAQADRLFELARSQAEAGQEGDAYRLLHEVLHEHPDHAEARRILGWKRSDRGWDRSFQRPSRRRTRGPHPQFGWASNQHWSIDSEHFELTTNLSVRGGQQVATYLERVYAVWQQLFYEYWSVAGRLAARFQGGDQSLGPDRTFSVVLFADRAEYVRQLSRSEPQIELSVGYYAQSHKTAFFYAGDDTARPNWAHESTHQFFQESGVAAPQVGEQNNYWAIEGVALYMESLIDRNAYAVTGGADADRLQFARYRKLSEQYYVPLQQLVALGRQQIQQDPKIRELYSQCAGLAHLLMHGDDGRLWRPFTNYLTSVYRGVGQTQTLSSETGREYDDLDQAYQAFLNVTDADLVFLDPGIRSLCLGHTSVTDAGLQHIRDCNQLRWLDLSFTSASDAGVAWLGDLKLLEQLNFEKTKITDRTVELVGDLRQLEELDLSQTLITDAGLKHLSRLSQLSILWLTGTQVTDEGLTALAPLRSLEQLELEGTRVTPAALDQLRKRLPNLK